MANYLLIIDNIRKNRKNRKKINLNYFG